MSFLNTLKQAWMSASKEGYQTGVPDPLAESRHPDRTFLMAVAGESQTNEDGSSRQKLISKLKPGMPLMLVREPDNPYDPDAISIRDSRGSIFGYIPRAKAGKLARQLDGDVEVAAWVEDITGGTTDKPTLGLILKLGVMPTD